MKGLFASLAMLCALCLALPAAQAKPLPGAKYTYTLKSVMPVAGRQGVACDGKFIYVSCSKALYKYDMNGKLVAENKNPSKATPSPPTTSVTSMSTTARSMWAPKTSWTAWARTSRSPSMTPTP